MLAQVALIVFAWFAVLSLIIDVGYARLTQGQMQNAADTAALEAVRYRDSVDALNGNPDPFLSDCERRAAANRLVRRVFDDDLDPANGDPDFQFGAGPIIDLTDGVTSLHALATISVPDAHVYKPDLQLNQQNAVHGDMVSGSFSYSSDPIPSEDLTYGRNDFEPNPAAPQPPVGLSGCSEPDQPPPAAGPLPSPGSLTNGNDNAFLVRLRRSNELVDLAAQTETDVASSGPSLPLVFGRGTTIFGDDASGGYSVRRDGLTVRATAIARVRPALHVGLPQTNPSMPGVTPFAPVDTCVQNLNANGYPVTVNPANGFIMGSNATCTGNGIAPPTAVVGRFVANPTAISTVGQLLPPSVPVACANSRGYGPVYSLMLSGTNRIIGFTRINLSADPARPANPCAKVMSRGVPLVAASNATAHLADGLPLPAGSSSANITELLDKNLVRNGGVNYAPVLVAVLAR